jgi:hypothetical protein
VRLISVALFVLVLAGCSSGGSTASRGTGPANTQVDPGPKPTYSDPGPNNTANGPQTLQGTLTAHSGCVELAGNAAHARRARFQLEFEVEKVGHVGNDVVLTGPDAKRTVGPRDTVYVAGRPGSGSGPCGLIFRVEKVVAVVPAT